MNPRSKQPHQRRTPRTDPESARLLHGSYRAPPLKRGDRAHCHLRDTTAVVTSWSGGRIPWPRCRADGTRGGSGLLVDDELLRAVRTESLAAVAYWWGIYPTVVSKWRRKLGVGRLT